MGPEPARAARFAFGQQDSAAGEPKQNQAPSAEQGSPGHIFWIIPAFKVNYQKGGFQPLSRREKFDEWARGAYDPLGLAAGGIEAGLEYSHRDGFCGYGTGLGGYGKCFGSAELDANISSFFGDFVLTVAMHQDPRYFRRGEGSFRERAWYAISRVFVTYSDSGRLTFDASALLGTGLAAAASNLYYPRSDRGFRHSVTRVAWDLGDTAAYNLAAEFWPDIRHKLYRVF